MENKFNQTNTSKINLNEIRKLEERKKGLLEAIEQTKKKKSAIIPLVHELVSQLRSGRITRQEHDEKISKALGGRSAEQWIKYYDDYLDYYNYQIKLCERLISQEKYRGIKQNVNKFAVPVLKIFIVLVIMGIFISFIFILWPVTLKGIGNVGEKVFSSFNQLMQGTTGEIQPSVSEITPTVGEGELFSIEPTLPVNLEDSGVLIKEESLIQYQAVVGQPVKWKKQFTTDSLTGFNTKLPENSENVVVKTNGEDITNSTNIKEEWIGKEINVELKKSMLTGNVIGDEQVGEGENYEIIYETPAPKLEEEQLSNGKRILISGPDDVHYKNILSFANIEEINQEELNKFQLYQVVNGKNQAVKFTAYDTNENGLYDYIEWITPELSFAEFLWIIEITKAELLDENKNFVEDIYEQVKAKDNNWFEVPSGDYIRVTFEQKLDNTKDITLYAKGNGNVEVYEINSNKKLIDFEINGEKEYKKFLTELGDGVNQDVFDLRFFGNVEVDWVVDPFTNCGPGIWACVETFDEVFSSIGWALLCIEGDCNGYLESGTGVLTGAMYGSNHLAYYNNIDSFTWTNYKINVPSVTIDISGGDGMAGIAFRIQTGGESFYYAVLDTFYDKILFGKFVNQVYNPPIITEPFINSGESHKLSVEVEGNNIKIFVDDMLKITTTDNSFMTGGVGAFASNEYNPNAVDFYPTWDEFQVNFIEACTDECASAGLKQCSGNSYQTCGNYDADSCLEWSSSAIDCVTPTPFCNLANGDCVQCTQDSECGTCQKCSNNICVNQADTEDLKNECDDSSITNIYFSCSNPYTRIGGDGFCGGVGACDINDASKSVSDGNVCIAGEDTNPTPVVNCGIWSDCVVNSCSAQEYFVGYIGGGGGICSATDWQIKAGSFEYPINQRISATIKADSCTIDSLACSNTPHCGTGNELFNSYTCNGAGNCNVNYNSQGVCGTGASENDGGQIYITAGTCIDNTGCSGNSCQSTNYLDACGVGNILTEYFVSGDTCLSEQYDCNSFNTCSGVTTGQENFIDYGCGNGACSSVSFNRDDSKAYCEKNNIGTCTAQTWDSAGAIGSRCCGDDGGLTDTWLSLNGVCDLGVWHAGGDCLSDAECTGNKKCIDSKCRGLISWWKFDETSGTNVLDSADGNNGIIFGDGDELISEIFRGGVINLDGQNDYVSGLPKIQETSTISYWAKTEVGDGNTGSFNFASWNDDLNFFEFRAMIDPPSHYSLYNFWAYSCKDGTCSFEDGSRDDFSVGTSAGYDYRDNKWHHILITFENAIGKVYVDGVYIGQDSVKFPTWDTATNSITNLGKSVNYNFNPLLYYYFNGAIDDVQIYDRDLTDEEILALYLEQLNDSHAPDINFTYPTNPSGTQEADNIFVNVSAKDYQSDISTFIDFDNSLVGWWRMDDVGKWEYYEGAQNVVLNSGLAFVTLGYTKPVGASFKSLWQVKHGGINAYNVSIPRECWDYLPDKINFKIYANHGSGVGYGSYGKCQYGSGANDWKIITKILGGTSGGDTGSISNGGPLVDGYWNTGALYVPGLNWNTCLSPECLGNVFYEEGMNWFIQSPTDKVVRDYSEKNNDGTRVGDVAQISGELGKAMSFDGNGDYIDVANNPSLDLSSNDFTIGGWVFSTSSSSNMIITKRDNGGYGFIFSIYQNKLNFLVNNKNTGPWIINTQVGIINNNVWNHLAVIRRGNDFYGYINGVEYYFGSMSGSVYNPLGPVRIGADYSSGTDGIIGSIDDVMIFNRALSNHEINALYANQSYKHLERDFTGLSLGQHNFKAYAQDKAGNVNETEKREVEIIGNQAPTIDSWTINSGSPLSCLPISINHANNNFRVYVSDVNGVGDLVDGGQVKVYFEKNNNIYRPPTAPTFPAICDYFDNDGINTAYFDCSIDMYYYDEPENWIIHVSATDGELDALSKISTGAGQPYPYFYYNTLADVRLTDSITPSTPAVIEWGGSDLNIGTTNRASDNHLIIKNCGNVLISSLTSFATNLVGNTNNDIISPNSFSISENSDSCNNGVVFNSDGITPIPLDIVDIPVGVESPSRDVYFCLKEVIKGTTFLRADTYQTRNPPLPGQGSWDITGVGAFILSIIKSIGFNFEISLLLSVVAVRVKRKKKEKKLKLNEEDILRLDSVLKDKYNLGIEELLNQAKEKVKKQVQEEREIKIPIFIFKQKLSPAEALCKYMKENLEMRYSEISKIINRDERTIWINYRNAVKKFAGKMKDKIKIKTIDKSDRELLININLLSNRKLSILESVVKYLKEKGLRNCEIAKMIGKSQRNVYTLYNRAMKKMSG